MWNKNEIKGSPYPPSPSPSSSQAQPQSQSQPQPQGPSQPSVVSVPAPSESSRRETSSIGSSLTVKGELTGDEDLVVHGRVEGKILLTKNAVTVGKNGRVKADIHAKSVRVAGHVEGNLVGDDEVVIHQSGRAQGNITAPRVTLESGARFKGTIEMDMGPGDALVQTREKTSHTSASAHDDGARPTPAPVGDPVVATGFSK